MAVRQDGGTPTYTWSTDVTASLTSSDGRSRCNRSEKSDPVSKSARTRSNMPWHLYGDLRQPVKTQDPSQGELSHGIVEKDVDQGVQAGRSAAAGTRCIDRGGRPRAGSEPQRVAPLATGVPPRSGQRVSGERETALVGGP